MKTAVTEAASAAAADREPASNFLPSDTHYRMTGEMPDAVEPAASQRSDQEDYVPAVIKKEIEQEKEPKPEKEPASAAGDEDADTAEASAASTTQERKPKTPQTSESRWAKLSRENRELKDRLARLEKGQTPASPEKRDAQPGSQPAAEVKSGPAPRPKIDDVDPKTGQPKFKSFAEYDAAKDDWLQAEALRKFEEKTATTAKQTAAEQQKQIITQEWGKRVEKAGEKFADFRDVALNPALPVKEGSPVDLFILDSTVGPEVLYHLGKNPQELERINALHPLAQVRELTKIEMQLVKPAAAAPSPAKPVTQAPRPPHQVSGKNAVTKDAVDKAVEDGDSETYIREQNARDLARRRKGK